ncbi:replication initiation and membrane attachment family protein [Bacillus sp. B1-b2]|uniref:replication initiation and membrane attachment family protein n=1 Tax=Bacillus sp. B1-b2 TaxID=2653201 RepID=UPI0012619480|nr:replication initiation and membrane attachment family protein [Bacillus sp. B1-b2]KAB7668022.1 Replication initiation and membrane attachment protein [Bacillus sp. B1-b2]
MSQHWHDLLPVDRYQVAVNGLINDYDRKIITFLYQPLIGTKCLGLYMTLWAEVEENRLWATSNTHHSLMNFMSCGLKEIYDARMKLEGMGLLKTYLKKEEDNRSFVYELQPPLSPAQFFLDGILNVYLYRKIGKNQYSRLKKFFSDGQAPDMKEYVSVTKAFQDVFMSDHISAIRANYELEDLEEESEKWISRKEQSGIQIQDDSFDFELLYVGIHESLLSQKAFTKKVKDAIQNLAFIYGIDPIQMKNIVISAINEQDEIDIEELRIAARDWYQFQHNNLLPKLVERTQPQAEYSSIEAPTTKEEELIYYLDHTSPKDVLKDISGGVEPSKADLQIIEEIMFTQKLLPGVINVLIQYVMLKTDMKLTKGYIDKIAGQWVRKNIKTVKDAMNLAKKEHKQYMEWAEGKKNPTNTTKRKIVRSEKIPEWFGQGQQKNGQPIDTEKVNQIPDNEEGISKKKQELEERIKNLRK